MRRTRLWMVIGLMVSAALCLSVLRLQARQQVVASRGDEHGYANYEVEW